MKDSNRKALVSNTYKLFDESINKFLKDDNPSREDYENIINYFNVLKINGQDTFEYIDAITNLEKISSLYPDFESVKEYLLKTNEKIENIDVERDNTRNYILDEINQYDSMRKKRTLTEEEVRNHFNKLNSIKEKMNTKNLNFKQEEYNKLLYEIEKRIASASEFIRLKKIVKGELSVI